MTFSVGKDPYAAFGMRDQWFWTSTNEQAYQNWHTRIQKWWQDLPDYWRNDVSDVLRGFKHSWSRPYYLE